MSIEEIFNQIGWDYEEGDNEQIIKLCNDIYGETNDENLKNIIYSLGCFGQYSSSKILLHIKKEYDGDVSKHYKTFKDCVYEALEDVAVKVVGSPNFVHFYLEYLLSEIIYKRKLEIE